MNTNTNTNKAGIMVKNMGWWDKTVPVVVIGETRTTWKCVVVSGQVVKTTYTDDEHMVGARTIAPVESVTIGQPIKSFRKSSWELMPTYDQSFDLAR